MDQFTFSDFRSGIVESAVSWHRVGKKMMWFYQPGEVIFLLKLIQPKAMKYFDIQLFYGHSDWIQDDNYEAISCGAQASYRALTRKSDLKLSVTYPGIEENFHGALFDSLLNSDIITRNRREKFPDMMNLELRKKDWTQFFEVLSQRLQPLHTLDDIENEFDGNLNSEFWDRMKKRVTNFPDCEPC